MASCRLLQAMVDTGYRPAVMNNLLDQNSDLSLGIAGLAMVILGLYLRHSFTRFLRFWLVRMSLEQQERDRR